MISKVLPESFDGDAHTLLIATYRDLSQPIEIRLDAAKAAIGYETPRLAAIDHRADIAPIMHIYSGVPRACDYDDNELQALTVRRRN